MLDGSAIDRFIDVTFPVPTRDEAFKAPPLKG